jgi:hypothetical protein
VTFQFSAFQALAKGQSHGRKSVARQINLPADDCSLGLSRRDQAKAEQKNRALRACLVSDGALPSTRQDMAALHPPVHPIRLM